MWVLWRALLSLVLLVGAGWFWTGAKSDAAGPGKGEAPEEIRIRHGAVEVAGNHGSTPDVRAGSLPPSIGAPRATVTDTQAADFHFELGVVEPDEGDDLEPWQVAVGDVTGDRRPDVVMSLNYSGNEPNRGHVRVRVYAQAPGGTLARPVEFDVDAPSPRHGMELVDLDRNGIPEITVVDGVRMTLFRRVGGTFERSGHVGPSDGIYPAPIDADGDGFMDLFAQGWDYGADVFLGDGRGNIRGTDHIDSPSSPDATVEASDFTADGLADVVVQSGHAVRIYPSRYQLALGAPIEFDLARMQISAPSGMTVADMDRDGRPDLVVSDQGDVNTTPVPKGVHILYRVAGNFFGDSVFLDTGAGYLWPGAVRVADVDGNGYPDVIAMLHSQDRMGYFLQGASGFAPMVTQLVDDDPFTNSTYYDNSFAIADVNSDRCPDVVLADQSSSLRVLYGRNCQVTLPRPSTPLPPRKR